MLVFSLFLTNVQCLATEDIYTIDFWNNLRNKQSNADALDGSIKLPNNLILQELSLQSSEARNALTMIDEKTAYISKNEQGNLIIFDKIPPQDFFLPYHAKFYRKRGTLFTILLAKPDYTLISQLYIFVCDGRKWPKRIKQNPHRKKLKYRYPRRVTPYSYIVLLKTEPSFRRQGYGRSLLQEAYKISKAHYLSNICLDIWDVEHNPDALALYVKEGFVRDENFHNFYVMCKAL